ncbi:dipeptide epimerase [Microaerobacter geothermalis]|uniref:mandelate racemase/muconate lactonizing enzyme family protein n=1 Tax=Microaerobacter geothermalis TaxID=674972 RepID=UPI001F31BCE5|nr:dipeptide epimerase [Microaerobacter geothermalis]MCF6093857.1 dipeptide epimerase [Microaerobacter geothermalis]
MKIKKVDIFGIKIPLKEPFIIAYETYTEIQTIILKMETDDGYIGFGEGTPDQYVTGETWESTLVILKNELAPLIIGEHPFSIENIHNKMHRKIKGVPTAKAAIDIACYDLMGKIAKQPLCRLLGGSVHDVITIPYVLSMKEPEKMALDALHAVQLGFSSIKIKVGSDPFQDIQRIKAVRDVVGPQIKLRVDANQGWFDYSTSVRVINEIEKYHIEWVEQPVHADEISLMSDIRKRTNIPIMIDEGLHGKKELLEVIKTKAADIINIKLMKCGGIYPALSLISMAEAAGIPCQIGSMVESTVATAAGAHLSYSRINIMANEMIGPIMFLRDISSLCYEKDKLLLSEKPGLGVEVNLNALHELTHHHYTISF